MTRTYVNLPVSWAAYQEIAEKLEDAHYDHAFYADGIDMHGLRLVHDGKEQKRLFSEGEHTLHSGSSSPFLIDVDAMSDVELRAVASWFASLLPPFCFVRGVPTGGLRLARAMMRHVSDRGPALLVDDVLTTGASIEAERQKGEIGAVLFARGPCPRWVTPMFTLWQGEIEWTALTRAVQGQIVSAIDAHGPIAKDLVTSLTKRVMGAVKAHDREARGRPHRQAEEEHRVSVPELIRWLENRPGASWRATLQDIYDAVSRIEVEKGIADKVDDADLESEVAHLIGQANASGGDLGMWAQDIIEKVRGRLRR